MAGRTFLPIEHGPDPWSGAPELLDVGGVDESVVRDDTPPHFRIGIPETNVRLLGT